MSKRKDPQRLTLLLGDIDPALLEEAYLTDSPEKLAKLQAESRPRRRRAIFMPRLAVAAVSVILALAMMMNVFILLRPKSPSSEWPTGTQDSDGTLPPDQPYVDPTLIEAPWKTGKLTLTSLTYKPSSEALSTGRISFDMLTDKVTDGVTDGAADTVTEPSTDAELGAVTDTETDAATDETTEVPTPEDPVFGTGENVQVSIMDNTKISDYMGPDLIKTRPTDGEHMRCADVYYNIYTAETVCMSCRVLALVQGTDLYTEAAIDAFREEILLDEVYLWAGGEVNGWREIYDGMLDSDTVRTLFSELKKPTLSKLGIDDFAFDSHETYVKEHIGDYKYPVVDIAEYGTDPDKCVYSLVSPLTGITYGSYVMDLTTGVAKRIDGKLVGDDDDNYTSCLPLNRAKDVTVLGDYQKLVVTLPYIASFWQRVDDHFVHTYSGDNVVIFDVATGVGRVLVPIDGEQDAKLPAAAAQVQENIVYYKTLGGQWCFYRMDGTASYTVESGELMRIIRTEAGARYAVMRQEGGYVFYELTGESGILTPVTLTEEDLDIGTRYVMEDNLRVDVLTGERIPLWDGTPAATAASKDGRFVYLYFEGADQILCIDVCKGERGAINLSESFVTQAAEAGDVSYGLLLNKQEDRLLMTYYKEGVVVFDFEAYKSAPVRGNDYDALLDYYTIGGQKLNFINRKNAAALLKLLYVLERVDAIEKENLHGQESGLTWRRNNARLAEALIEYLDVWGHNAEVPTALLNRMLGDISISEFELGYKHAVSTGNDEFESFELSTKYGHDEEKRLDGFARDHAKAAFVFFDVKYTDEQLAEMKALFRSVLDPAIRNCTLTHYRQATAFASVMDEACVIATGMTYDEFMKSGAWLIMPDGNDHFHAMTNAAGGDVRFSLYKYVDYEYLKGFMKDLSFVEGEKEITSIARVYREFGIQYYSNRCDVCVLWVGYDEDGRAYACIDGYYAEITAAEAEAFKNAFVGASKRIDSPVICYH